MPHFLVMKRKTRAYWNPKPKTKALPYLLGILIYTGLWIWSRAVSEWAMHLNISLLQILPANSRKSTSYYPATLPGQNFKFEFESHDRVSFPTPFPLDRWKSVKFALLSPFWAKKCDWNAPRVETRGNNFLSRWDYLRLESIPEDWSSTFYITYSLVGQTEREITGNW